MIRIYQQNKGPFNTSCFTDSYNIFSLKMESVPKIKIFGLKMKVKSGLEKVFLKFLHSFYLLVLRKITNSVIKIAISPHGGKSELFSQVLIDLDLEEIFLSRFQFEGKTYGGTYPLAHFLGNFQEKTKKVPTRTVSRKLPEIYCKFPNS